MKKRLLSTLLALCMALTLLPGTAFAAATSGSCGDNVRWSYSDGTLTIQGTGHMGYYYYDAPPWSVYATKIHTIIIGDGVTDIGDGAFAGCSSLTNVTIPDSVTYIYKQAFLACSSLTSVTIPNNVVLIDVEAFTGCNSLTSVTLPDSIAAIEVGTFWGCDSLTDVYYGGSAGQWSQIFIAGNNGPLINAGIHYNSTGPSTAPSSTFGSCGDNATWLLSDGVLTIQGTGKIDGYGPFTITDYFLYDAPPWSAFLGDIRTIIIGDGITAIGENTFSGCWSLTGVTIPNSVTSIGDSAFRLCASLTGVTIPSSVTTIGASAFSSCERLTSVTIPGSATIGDWAFQSCLELTNVTIFNGVTAIGNGAFSNCQMLTSVAIPSSVTTIGASAFSQCYSLTGVTIPASVNTIGDCAFEICAGLKNVYYGGSESQWKQISIGGLNEPLTGANILYTSAPAETDPSATTFTDVKTSDYFAGAVAWAVSGGVTVGTNDGTTFSPKQICTEVEILTMLYRAAGKPTADPSPVTVASWYQDAVNWAYEKDMIDASFKPDVPCTRASTVKYIWQAFGSKSAPASDFIDVSASVDDCYAAVNWAVANGVTGGTGGGAFNPDRTCMREEIVTFLHRAYVPEVRLTGNA